MSFKNTQKKRHIYITQEKFPYSYHLKQIIFCIDCEFFRVLLIVYWERIFSYQISLASNLKDNQNLHNLERWVWWTRFPPPPSLPIIAALYITQMPVETITVFIFFCLTPCIARVDAFHYPLRSCSSLLQAHSFATASDTRARLTVSDPVNVYIITGSRY